MSQKYKSFSKGNARTSDCCSGLPAGVKRMGYLKKLKKMQRRFFVLHMESNYGIARLEYFGSEKKWRLGSEPRRCIELKSCLNISRKPHPKYKTVISLYTQDDCFSVVTESEEDLELWLNDLLEVQKSFLEIDENARGRPVYEHLWQVMIDKHDLENDLLPVGSYRVALSSKSLFLIKMNPVNESDYFEFPLMSIRRCGHSKDHFFIELGRSSVIGAGEIYMATEGTVIAQNMHETVLSAMKSSKIREDGIPCPRPRSASTSENSNPVTSRRPIGIVAPQTVSLASSSGLSNSRERCDSLPTRPQTISGNPHNCLLGALSSPYASSGTTFRRLNSRPHSMYEWPSCKSPSTRNTIFSPSSISSTTGCSSSTEEVDSFRTPSVSLDLQSDGKISSDHPITEVPDEYLMMSMQEVERKINDGKTTEYLGMKSSISKSDSLKVGNLIPDCKTSCNDKRETPKSIDAKGYLDMSPSNSLPKDTKISSVFKDSVDVSKEENICIKPYELDKPASKIMPSVVVQDKNVPFTVSKIQPDPSSIPVMEVDLPSTGSFSSKPPLPKRMSGKSDSKSFVAPPLPIRSSEYKMKVALLNTNSSDCCHIVRNISTEFENKQDLSQVTQNDNYQYEEQDVFYSNSTTSNLKTSVITSPDQNTNFSCLTHSQKSNTHSLPCASICSANKTFTDVKQSNVLYKMEQCKNSADYLLKNNSRYSSSKNVCDNSELPLNYKTSSLSRSIMKSYTSSTLPPSAEKIYNTQTVNPEPFQNSVGDYVNIDLKKPCDIPGSLKSPIVTKPSTYLLPACSSTSDPSYSNIQFGKPICPTPKPVPASCDTALSAFNKSDRNPDDGRSQKAIVWSPTSTDLKSSLLAPKFRNIPNTLPAFRKQMSAPAGPLRPELPSPGRKSSCPVTASSSMVRATAGASTSSPMRPLLLQSHSGTALLRVSAASRSPDHSSVSSVSSASDEVSSAHSSPKTLCAPQALSAQYENVVIPQRLSSTSSRPSSTSSEEKELNYASLDLTPSTRDDPPCSPTVHQKPPFPNSDETLTYAQIDFTKSEGLKNTSGIVRESRL